MGTNGRTVARVVGKATTVGEGCAAGVSAEDEWPESDAPFFLCGWTLKRMEWIVLALRPTLGGDRGGEHCHTTVS